LLTVNPSARRPPYVRLRVWRGLFTRLERFVEPARRLGRGPRRTPGAAGRFMDYGPDWPPRREPPAHPHALLRRCVAVVVLYAVIWALGSVLLELRLYALRDVTGEPVTTYTTITGSPHHGHH
jgi:hypothetical protein